MLIPLRRAACLLPACLLLAAPARAEPEPFRVDGLPRGEALSIREAPDPAAPTVGEIPVGRRLLGFGCTNDTPSRTTWCRVRFGRTVGWARRRYLAPE
ncbi:SH3 domain-containing protein [Methylobacterium sp. A54F]